MTKHFNDVDARVLRGLITQASDDILVRLDPSGFIIHASANADILGIDLSALLLMPHISDLAEPEFVDPVASYALAALAGKAAQDSIEFPLAVTDESADEECSDLRRRWFSFSLRPIESGGEEQGGLGVLRSATYKHALAEELGAQAAIDPATGLTNRKGFCGSLARALRGQGSAQPGASMAIFAIDRMQAIFMQYGQATTDEIRWGFSRFLETMTNPSQHLAQLDEERFAILLPSMAMCAAREWAEDVLATFAGLTSQADCQSRELTASAGLAQVEMSVDWTLRQAELGLVMARAAGGMRARVCTPARRITNGAAVERAMHAAVERASRRQAQEPATRKLPLANQPR